MMRYSVLDSGAPGENKCNDDDYSSKSQRQPIRDSVGLARLWILALGTAAIVLAATLLALLWSGAAIAVSQGQPGQTWTSAVTQGWAPITVTLCAAAIRTAITLQAGVVMSMVASILLERHHAQLGDSVFLSIIRAVSVQPVDLLFTGGRGVVTSLGLVGFPLVIFECLITLASTFTSSILLSDFGNIAILGPSNTSMVGYGGDALFPTIDLWRSPPVQYPRFAEYANGSHLTGGGQIDDTGHTLRVPLPMADSERRQTLREYTGPAVVFDDRVVCVAPRGVTLLSFNTTISTQFSTTAGKYFSVEGYATFDSDLPPPLRGEPSEVQVPFRCLLPRTESSSLPSNITVCVVKPPSSVRELRRPFMLSPALPVSNISQYSPPIFLVWDLGTSTVDKKVDLEEFWNATYIPALLALNETTGAYKIPQEALTATREGFWHRTKIGNITALDGSVFSVSACAANTLGVPYNVTLTSRSDGHEPTLGWPVALYTKLPDVFPVFAYNTTAVRRQLGSTKSPNLSHAERGIMHLDFTATDWGRPLGVPVRSFQFRPDEIFPVLQTQRCAQKVHLCGTDPSALVAPGGDSEVGHPANVALFSDVLAETGSPARALQSLLGVLKSLKLYDSLQRFTLGAEARFARSVQVFAPQRWTGFFGVVALLACHLLAVATATTWYLQTTRHTMLGNSWQAVSQVASAVTLPVLQRATNLKDSRVAAIIREEIGNKGRYGISRRRRPDGGDRRELVAI